VLLKLLKLTSHDTSITLTCNSTKQQQQQQQRRRQQQQNSVQTDRSDICTSMGRSLRKWRFVAFLFLFRQNYCKTSLVICWLIRPWS